MSHFYTPWKRQKTFCFLTFSGGIEMWHCTALKWVKHLKVTVSELFRKQITVVRVQKSSTLIGFAQLQSFEKAKQTNKWINKITFLILACFDSDLSFIYNSLVIQFYHDLEFLKKKVVSKSLLSGNWWGYNLPKSCYEKCLLKNFVKFTGKHQFRSLFLK